MALVRTDYGLIYNTDGSLCATLLPEGGVAVTEGTTNGIQNGNFATGDFTGWTDRHPANGHKSIVTRDGINYARIVLTSDGKNFGIQSTKNITVAVGDKVTVSFRVRGEKPNYAYLMLTAGSNRNISSFIQYTDLPNGEYLGEYTWTADCAADVGFLFAYTDTPKSGEFTYAQLEKKPYATPFVDGTRPPGALDIPTNLSLLQSGTIAFTVWTPKKMTDHDTFQNGALMDICRGDVRQLDLWMRDLGIEFCVNGGRKKTISYEPNTKYKIIVTWEDGGNPKFYVDGALQYAGTEQFTDAGNGILQLGRFGGSFVNTVNFKNLLICPYAVSPETIATWHSLDAPFYDPREITTAELAAREYAEAQAELARVTAEAYADGKVTAEEQARIADAEAKLNAAKQYAEAQAELARVTAEAYADGKVTAEEQARIADAQQKLQEAKQYAEQKAQEAEAAATAVANEAKQAAADAQSAADTANALLADIASDSKLTPDEKQATKKEWDIIVGEKPVIEAQATTYEITTEKTAYTAAYNALNTYITPLLQNLTSTSSITGSTFRSKFKDYYDAKTALLKKISDVAYALTQEDIDAEKKPVYVKGAGADIDIDKYGIRATRKADGKKTFEIDAETGDAYFRGDITGASGTFSGNLSAEKIMAGIVAAGGITAEYIKTGTLTYDTMNVGFAAINNASWMHAAGSASITIDTIATTQDEWNIIRIDFSNFYGGVLRIRHNNLSILSGVAEIGIGDSKTSWLDIGFKLAGGLVYYKGFDIYITALEGYSTIIRLEPEQPPFSGTRYIFLKRHAIL